MLLSEIKKDCQKKFRKATINTYEDGSHIIDESFDVFYSQGNPHRKRKNILPGAAYTPEPVMTDTSAYIELGYEGDQIEYPPKDGTFCGGEVLGATMTGTYGVVGDSNYDNDAFKKIGESVDKNFDAEFG